MARSCNVFGRHEQAPYAGSGDTLAVTWERSLGGDGTIFIALCLAASPVAGGFFYAGGEQVPGRPMQVGVAGVCTCLPSDHRKWAQRMGYQPLQRKVDQATVKPLVRKRTKYGAALLS